jgi:hypothetical protein
LEDSGACQRNDKKAPPSLHPQQVPHHGNVSASSLVAGLAIIGRPVCGLWRRSMHSRDACTVSGREESVPSPSLTQLLAVWSLIPLPCPQSHGGASESALTEAQPRVQPSRDDRRGLQPTVTTQVSPRDPLGGWRTLGHRQRSTPVPGTTPSCTSVGSSPRCAGSRTNWDVCRCVRRITRRSRAPGR